MFFVVVLFLSDQISLRHNRTFYLTFLIEDGDRKWTGKKVGEKYSWDLMIRARLMSQKCKDKMKGHVTLVAVLNLGKSKDYLCPDRGKNK